MLINSDFEGEDTVVKKARFAQPLMIVQPGVLELSVQLLCGKYKIHVNKHEPSSRSTEKQGPALTFQARKGMKIQHIKCNHW